MNASRPQSKDEIATVLVVETTIICLRSSLHHKSVLQYFVIFPVNRSMVFKNKKYSGEKNNRGGFCFFFKWTSNGRHFNSNLYRRH